MIGSRTMLAAALALAAAPATAQGTAAAEPPLAGGPDFISPMGEPVRSSDTLSGAEHWFAAVDADHDGKLTRVEFMADAHRFFARLDSDRDGEIGPEEIERYETVIAPEIRVASTGSSFTPSSGDESDSDATQPPYPDRIGAGRYSYIDLPEPLIAADANFDRAISAAEFDRAANARFTQLDANGDGVITRSELPKLKAAGDRDTPRRKGRGGGGGAGGRRRGGSGGDGFGGSGGGGGLGGGGQR